MLKNGTPASPAMARASRVLPVPGGPTRRQPLGILPPSLVNFLGSFRKAMISWRSSFASSTPATSENVILCWFSVNSFARLLPKDMALPPPTCIWRIKKIHTPINNSMGNQLSNRTMYQGDSSSGFAAILTRLSRNDLTNSGSFGAKVLKRSPFLYLPWILCPWITTSCTSPRSTEPMNSLKTISGSRPCCLLKTLKITRKTNANTSHRAICFDD